MSSNGGRCGWRGKNRETLPKGWKRHEINEGTRTGLANYLGTEDGIGLSPSWWWKAQTCWKTNHSGPKHTAGKKSWNDRRPTDWPSEESD
jgi:hypothetical protein